MPFCIEKLTQCGDLKTHKLFCSSKALPVTIVVMEFIPEKMENFNLKCEIVIKTKQTK